MPGNTETQQSTQFRSALEKTQQEINALITQLLQSGLSLSQISYWTMYQRPLFPPPIGYAGLIAQPSIPSCASLAPGYGTTPFQSLQLPSTAPSHQPPPPSPFTPHASNETLHKKGLVSQGPSSIPQNIQSTPPPPPPKLFATTQPRVRGSINFMYCAPESQPGDPAARSPARITKVKLSSNSKLPKPKRSRYSVRFKPVDPQPVPRKSEQNL